MLEKLVAILGTTLTAGVVFSGVAYASTIGGGANPPTSTSPEYILANGNATTNYTPGHATFTSTVNHRGWQESAYLVTGYSRGHNDESLNGHYGRDYAYRIPAPVEGTTVKSGMTYSGTATRPGWDLWLVPTSHSSRDTSSTTMGRDSDAAEIMVQPGRGGFISNPGSPCRQHRAYVGGGKLRSENLTSIADSWLKRMHLNPASYSWQAIDGGYEGDAGSFALHSYSLSVTARSTYKTTQGYNAKACKGKICVWEYRKATTSSTYTASLRGESYSTAHAATETDAKDNAVYRAKTSAKSRALKAANAVLKART